MGSWHLSRVFFPHINLESLQPSSRAPGCWGDKLSCTLGFDVIAVEAPGISGSHSGVGPHQTNFSAREGGAGSERGVGCYRPSKGRWLGLRGNLCAQSLGQRSASRWEGVCWGSPRCWRRGKETLCGRCQFEVSWILHLALRSLDTSAFTYFHLGGAVSDAGDMIGLFSFQNYLKVPYLTCRPCV